MKRSWEELDPIEQEEYFHWVIMLMECGRLDLMDTYEVELKAKRMYELDASYSKEQDPFSGLDIKFGDYDL